MSEAERYDAFNEALKTGIFGGTQFFLIRHALMNMRFKKPENRRIDFSYWEGNNLTGLPAEIIRTSKATDNVLPLILGFVGEAPTYKARTYWEWSNPINNVLLKLYL